MYQNFKTFKYTLKPQTAHGSKQLRKEDLKSPLYDFSDKTINTLEKIH